MVVKIASYHGLFGTKTFGLSDDYSCEIDVTCIVKKQCDGLHECNITVNDNLFSSDLCPGLSDYLYFEYQCGDTVKPYKEPCGKHGDQYESFDGYNFIVLINFPYIRAVHLQLWQGADHRLPTMRKTPYIRNIRYSLAWQNHLSFLVFLEFVMCLYHTMRTTIIV